MENITVRDARKEDAQGIAALIVLAWPVEEFLAMKPGLGMEGLVGFIRKLVEAEDNLYSYRYTKVAVTESGKVAGMMNGYDGAKYGMLKKPVLDAMAVEFEDSGDFGRVTETGPGEFYLDSAGVDPEMRSRGIGSMLFDAMIARAAGEGFKVVGLIVDEDKPRAEALYRRLGFESVGYKDFLGHRMIHMQKHI